MLAKLWRILVSPALRLQLYYLRLGFAALGPFHTLRLLLAAFAGTPRLQVPAPGMPHPVWLRPGTSDIAAFHQVFLRREYALPEVTAPRLIIDGGANAGYTAVFLATLYPGAHVWTIEPEPTNFALVQANTASFTNITAVHAALWSSEQPVSIANPADEKWAAAVQAGSGSETIPGLTISALLQRAGASEIDLLKLDIEGAEREVFAGDTNWLARTRVLVIELHEEQHPGSSANFERALAPHPFQRRSEGEHQILVRT